MSINDNIGVFGKVSETEAASIVVENSLGRTADIDSVNVGKAVNNTQSLDFLVEQSLARTAAISTPVQAKQVANTQAIELPVVKSLCVSQNKNCFLNGGITKSANVSLGGDNIVYANVRISAENNALTLKDDGLYVTPIDYTVSTDSNINLEVDNAMQTISAVINNSPRLNNKLEYELDVNSALNYAIGGNIEQALNAKVDKIIGKGLSECDYTSIDKSKLNNLNTSNYINLINYDANNQKLTIADDTQTKELPLLGLLTNASYNPGNGRLTFSVANGNAINIDIPKDNFVSAGSYNKETMEIILTLANGSVIKIPANDIAPLILGGESATVNVSVDSSNRITSIVKVSKELNNALILKSDGLFVPLIDKNSLNINNVNNTADMDKPISTLQKDYFDTVVGGINANIADNYIKKEVDGNINIKTVNGRIIFFVNGLAQMEISNEGVNFLV